METTGHGNEHPKYLTVPQFCKAHQWATLGGIRHLIFHERSNGFSKCVRRIGKRVLLNEEAVFAWIEEQNGASKSHAEQGICA